MEVIIATGITGAVTLIVSLINLIANKITSKKNVTKEDLQKGIDKVELNNCKNFLVQIISAADRRELSSAEKERFWENFDTYVKLGGNSYIHTAAEKLKKEGKL